MKMALQNILLLSNRSILNLNEVIKLLKKPNLNSDDVVQCYNLEAKPGLWYMCAYNQRFADSIEWQSTGTHSLPNEKYPTVLVDYFSSEKVIKSVYRLTNKNKYDAVLVNYSDLNPIVEILKRTHISKKKSIKNILKSRFKLIKKDSNSVSNELIKHEPAEKYVGNTFGQYLGVDGSLPGGSTFVESTAQIVQSAPSAPTLSTLSTDFNDGAVNNALSNDSNEDDGLIQQPVYPNIENIIMPLHDENNLEINNGINEINEFSSYETAKENLIEENTLKQYFGRRIVDMMFIFKQIKKSRHTGGFGCTFLDMQFASEKQSGFRSSFKYECEICNCELIIYSEEKVPSSYIPINETIVSGTIAAGIGYSQLSELTASLDIPCMSNATYNVVISKMGDTIHDAALQEMKLAGEEERKFAIETGCFDDDGVPMCTVIGQRSKQSYKTKYDALSGVATIIGYKSKKNLFIGIRNDYCVIICQRAANKKTTVPKHQCFLNWTKGAAIMEADAIAEGFKRSVEMYGLKFNKLIGDGDFNVTKRLLELMPYGPNLLVENIECRNHLLRNYGTKLATMIKNTNYTITLRNHTKNDQLRFRFAITKALFILKFLGMAIIIIMAILLIFFINF